MPAVIVVGAQYGGEGKGKVVAYLSGRDHPRIVAKTSGPNCRHRIYLADGRPFDLRMLPAAVEESRCSLIISPGTLVRIETLLREIEYFGCHKRVCVDPMSGVIDDTHIQMQSSMRRYQEIGTTYSGTGTGSAERCLRRLRLARDCPQLQRYVRDTVRDCNETLRLGGSLLVEGGQSFWLSNYHGDYPFVTSRDTTASAFASQVGIGPRHVADVVLCVKCFPTRNSNGALPNEILEGPDHPARGMAEGVSGIDGSEQTIIRRYAALNIESVVRAAVVNSASQIALTGVDLYDPVCAGARRRQELSTQTLSLIEKMEAHTQVPVTLVSTGPKTYQMIDMSQ